MTTMDLYSGVRAVRNLWLPSGPEGLRVELFAQELKTLVPVSVSVKRLQKL